MWGRTVLISICRKIGFTLTIPPIMSLTVELGLLFSLLESCGEGGGREGGGEGYHCGSAKPAIHTHSHHLPKASEAVVGGATVRWERSRMHESLYS